MQTISFKVYTAVCHKNKNFTQTAGQVAYKSHPSYVIREQTLPWKPITIAINLTYPQDRLLT